jgi:hypothetical protein
MNGIGKLFLLFSMIYLVNCQIIMRSLNNQLAVNVSVMVKTPASPEYGYGFVEGYVVNGYQSPTVTIQTNPLAPNTNFQFLTDNTVPCSFHPVYLTTDPAGQNFQSSVGEIFSGVQERFPNGTLCPNGQYCACQGGSLFWSPTNYSSQLPVGESYYYQCRIHAKMGGPVIVEEGTMCDIAVVESGASAETLLNYTSFQTLINSNSTMVNYFNGQLTGQDVMTGSNLPSFLANHVSYFGQLFMCNDGTISNYTGPDLNTAHQLISQYITNSEWTIFINYFMSSLSIFFPPTTFNYLSPRFLSMLTSVKPSICKGDSSCRTSLCDLYTDYNNLTGYSQVYLANVVNYAFNNLQSNLYPNLNGQDGPNYLMPGTYRTSYVNALVSFLAQNLNCSQTGIAPFNMTDQQLVSLHSSFIIDQLQYQGYLLALLGGFNDYGMAPSDQDTVLQILTRPSLTGICNQPNCNPTFQTPITYVFTVGPKVTTPWKDGYSMDYYVDGNEAQNLTLFVGTTYIFLNNAGCSYPLYISTSPYGGLSGSGPVQPVTEGISQTGLTITEVCDGNTLFFTPTPDQATGPQLYYQSAYYERMGYYLNVCFSNYSSCSSGAPMLTTGTPSTPVNAAALLYPLLFLLSLFLFSFFL